MAWQNLDKLIESHNRSGGDPLILLLTISHALLVTPLRFVSPVRQSVVSNGNTFLPTRFNVSVGSEKFDQPSTATLEIESTDGILLSTIRTLRAPVLGTIQVAFASDPDDIGLNLPDFELGVFEQTGYSILTAEFAGTRFLGPPFPGISMDRSRAPGLYTNV